MSPERSIDDRDVSLMSIKLIIDDRDVFPMHIKCNADDRDARHDPATTHHAHEANQLKKSGNSHPFQKVKRIIINMLRSYKLGV